MNFISYTPKQSFSWKQKINPVWWFGNADDGIYGPDSYMPESSKIIRAINWFFRNPLHNFTFYVIGFRDKPSITYGKEPNKKFIDGFNYAFTFPYKYLPLPFISYQGSKFKCYAGWRCPGGSFGFKFTRV